MNIKNTKKSPVHENADANITCDFGDCDISRLGVAYQTHVYIHNYLDYIKIIVTYSGTSSYRLLTSKVTSPLISLLVSPMGDLNSEVPL